MVLLEEGQERFLKLLYFLSLALVTVDPDLHPVKAPLDGFRLS